MITSLNQTSYFFPHIGSSNSSSPRYNPPSQDFHRSSFAFHHLVTPRAPPSIDTTSIHPPRSHFRNQWLSLHCKTDGATCVFVYKHHENSVQIRCSPNPFSRQVRIRPFPASVSDVVPLTAVTRRFAKLFSMFRNYLRENASFFFLFFVTSSPLIHTTAQSRESTRNQWSYLQRHTNTPAPPEAFGIGETSIGLSLSLSSASSGRRRFFASITRFFHHPLIATKWPQNSKTAL